MLTRKERIILKNSTPITIKPQNEMYKDMFTLKVSNKLFFLLEIWKKKKIKIIYFTSYRKNMTQCGVI